MRHVFVYKLAHVAMIVALLMQMASVAYAQETSTVVTPPKLDVKPEAPPEVQSFAARLLGFLMFIAWVVFFGMLAYTGIQYMQGDKEAPQRLRLVLIGGAILAFSFTFAYYAFR
ncbi:hypothetical protein [Pyrodictium delaneyi]|nr:hypothetical protein [Pyrodictium delaneyi]